jgi:2-dehydro-3-deoxyphosphogluconate aldolase / (4S)-4-hydroxy-2-oxoglutarate aldolase
MNDMRILQQMIDCRAIGIIRVQQDGGLVEIVRALQKGGLRCIEITMTTPGALRAIERVREECNDVIMGAGTVIDGPTAREAILAGAQFLVTPTVSLDAIKMANRYGVVIVSGAMTPTEMLTAWEAGADLIKVFPADALGPGYLKAVHGPLPQIPLVPTGGITGENAGEYIRAGAAMVCVGGWLVDTKTVSDGRFDVLESRARLLIDAIQKI